MVSQMTRQTALWGLDPQQTFLMKSANLPHEVYNSVAHLAS